MINRYLRTNLVRRSPDYARLHCTGTIFMGRATLDALPGCGGSMYAAWKIWLTGSYCRMQILCDWCKFLPRPVVVRRVLS